MQTRERGLASSAPFALLLRSARLQAGFTQSELAERADVSVRAVAALEGGERGAPYRDTVAALARGLELGEPESSEFEAAADVARSRRRRVPARSTLGNLPYAATSFVGRAALLREAADALLERRCVALIGRGGVGKTRTALVLAQRVATRFADGAWFVDLSAAADERAIVTKIAATIAGGPIDDDDVGSLCRSIGQRNLLIVLDNCEAVAAPATAVLEAIVRRCSASSIVATSTVALGLEPASLLRVAPLEIPGTMIPGTMRELASYAAVRLFMDRCEQYGCRISARDDLARIVASIGRRLEGVPLAIELAASRAAMFGLSALEAAIDTRFDSALGSFVDGPARHRSLFAAIDWSHDLLDENERIALRRLSIFSGGFDLEAAAAVCAAPPLDRVSIDRLIASLADYSLVSIDVTAGDVRWSLFDSIRSYASERLHGAGEAEPIARRHAEYYARYAGGVTARSFSSSSQDYVDDMRAEHDNIEAAVNWGMSEAGDAAAVAEMFGGLRMLWNMTGRSNECLDIADALLARIDARRHPRAAAELHLNRGLLLRGQEALASIERAIDWYGRCDDAHLLAVARIHHAASLTNVGRFDDALAAVELAAACVDEKGNPRTRTTPRFALSVENARGMALKRSGRLREAGASYAAALRLAIASDDGYMRQMCELFLGEIQFALGDVEGAVSWMTRCVAHARDGGSIAMQQYALANLAGYHVASGDLREAARYVERTLALGAGESYAEVDALQHAAAILALRGDVALAAELAGYVEWTMARSGQVRTVTEERSNAFVREALAREFSSKQSEHASASGPTLTLERALHIARLAVA